MRDVVLTRARLCGATTGWWLLLPLVWLAVPLLAQITLPPVDPTLEVETRPLEQLSSMALVLGVSHLSWLLGDSASWISCISPRSAVNERLMRVVVLACVGVIGCLVVSVMLPAGVTWNHTVAVWLLLFGCAVGMSAVLGRSFAAAGPAAIVGTSSLGGAVIWPWNVVYNVDARLPLTAVSLGLLLIGVAAFVRYDERGARQARLGRSTSNSV